MAFKRSGDIIQGYRLDGDPQMSGQSAWAFATKGSKSYFIKQFLSPVQPARGDAGSAKTYNRRKAAADSFEKRHAKLFAISSKKDVSPNLILPIQAGWIEGKYTKIFRKISAVDVQVADVSKQSRDKRALLMLQLAEALQSLHQYRIVHSDIKWTNILFEREKETVVPKLIDFDAGYSIEDRPADPDDIIFDAPYAAPEIWKFVRTGKSADGEKLGYHSDIFSLGVLFHEMACGTKPLGEKSVPYYGQHLLSFAPSMRLTSRSSFFELVSSMLNYDTGQRPNIQGVIGSLSEILGYEETKPSEKSVSSGTPLSEAGDKGATAAADITSRATGEPTKTEKPSFGLKGMLMRTFGWMRGKPHSSKPHYIEKKLRGDLEHPAPPLHLPPKASPVREVEPRIKVSGSFASAKITERSEGRLKMTMSNKSERTVTSVRKTTSRIKLPEESKIKTTIKG